MFRPAFRKSKYRKYLKRKNMKQILTICALISVACSAAQKKSVQDETHSSLPATTHAKPKPAQNEILAAAKANHELLNHVIDRLEAIEQGLAILLNNLVRDTNHEKAVAMAKSKTAAMQTKALAPMAKAKQTTQKAAATVKAHA
jgi:hypothetical protein